VKSSITMDRRRSTVRSGEAEAAESGCLVVANTIAVKAPMRIQAKKAHQFRDAE